IKNGLIVDGTGIDGYRGAVGIEDNTVRIFRGDMPSVAGAFEIDAAGRVVASGFIDMHAHSGLMMLAHPEHEPKVRQGVTTEVIRVDGNSYAPFRSHADFVDFVELNSGLDGDPDLRQEWATVGQYLEVFDRKVAVNVAYLI